MASSFTLDPRGLVLATNHYSYKVGELVERIDPKLHVLHAQSEGTLLLEQLVFVVIMLTYLPQGGRVRTPERRKQN